MSAAAEAVSAQPDPLIVRDVPTLERVVAAASRCGRIAIDVEGNGLFSYKARLCTVQLAWIDVDTTHVAIVDTLAVDPAPLAALCNDSSAIKVLHDLTFDARMLLESGVPMIQAHDTAVLARFLGHEATGLARVLHAELGIHVDKGLQQHDWSRRPLGPAELAYLADDVRHLVKLYDRLMDRARECDIVEEIEEECRYRLRAASRPPADTRPPYARVKHASSLTPVARAVLRALFEVRDGLAHAVDVPPFRIVGHEPLVAIARALPRDMATLFALAGRPLPSPPLWLEAIERAAEQGDVPEDERVHFARRAPPTEDHQRRRLVEARLAAWRRDEAARRTLNEQVVLPGHCLSDLADLMLRADDVDQVRAGLSTIEGLGEKRALAYANAWSDVFAALGVRVAAPSV